MRDALKDKILNQINIPILRIATNESGEKEKLIKMLNLIVKSSSGIDEEDERLDLDKGSNINDLTC